LATCFAKEGIVSETNTFLLLVCVNTSIYDMFVSITERDISPQESNMVK